MESVVKGDAEAKIYQQANLVRSCTVATLIKIKPRTDIST